MDDPFDLDRFLNAQASVFPQVLAELAPVKNAATGSGSSFPR